MIGRLYTGDTGRELLIPIETGDVDGTTVTAATVGVRTPTGTTTTWDVTIDSATTTTVNLLRVTIGSDISAAGTYSLRVWLYAGGDMVGVTAVDTDLRVLATPIPWPTDG